MNDKTKAGIAIVAVLAVICIFGVTQFYGDNAWEPGDKIIIATSPDFAPYEFLDNNNVISGIDMDILDGVFAKLGYVKDVDYEYKAAEFDAIIAGVNTHKFTIGASGFTITDERKEQVLFTEPYASAKQVVILKKGSTIDSLEDLYTARIAAQTGTTGQYLITDVLEPMGAKLDACASYSFCALSLISGTSDAIIMDDTSAMGMLSKNPDFYLSDIVVSDEVENYAYAIAKNNTLLAKMVNGALSEMIAAGITEDIFNWYASFEDYTDAPSYWTAHEKEHGWVKGEKVIIATSPDFEPYDFLDANNNITGIDMDILDGVFAKLGYEKGVDYEYKAAQFDSIVTGVMTGKFTMGASGFTVTEVRKTQIDFTNVYTQAKQVVVLPKNSTIRSVEDLYNASITVQVGTTGDYLVTDELEIKGARIDRCNTYTNCVLSLKNGISTAFVVDDAVAEGIVNENPDFYVSNITLPGALEEYAFVLNKNNYRLLAAVNAAMTEMTENNQIKDIIAWYEAHGNSKDTPSYWTVNTLPGLMDLSKIKYEGQDQGFDFDKWIESVKLAFYNDFISNDYAGAKLIGQGFVKTIEITLLALVLGVILGILIAAVRSLHDSKGKLKILNGICKLYVTIIRGTPVVVQLMIIYYIILASYTSHDVLIAALAFGLNSAAYVSEIIRAGINAIPKGQMEACTSLGLPYKIAMMSVILPQAIRNILPALCNEGISLLKETSIAGYVTITDLNRAAQLIQGRTYDPYFPILLVACIYLALVVILTYLVGKLEKRLNNVYR